MHLETRQPDSLRAVLEIASVRAPVDSGPRDAIRLTLDCPTGRVQLPMALGARFPWPSTRPAPTAAGIALGSTRADVERLFGGPDQVVVPEPGLTLLVYDRRGLQVLIWRHRVAGVNLLTLEAGSIDGLRPGMHIMHTVLRWGTHTGTDRRTGAPVWSATGWEIVSHTNDDLFISALQLRINDRRDCPFVTDSTGIGSFVCDLSPEP